MTLYKKVNGMLVKVNKDITQAQYQTILRLKRKHGTQPAGGTGGFNVYDIDSEGTCEVAIEGKDGVSEFTYEITKDGRERKI